MLLDLLVHDHIQWHLNWSDIAPICDIITELDLNLVNRFNHTSWVTAVTPTDRPKSVRNSCVIKVFGGVFMLSRCLLDCSVGVGVFVTRLSQISSFFSYYRPWPYFSGQVILEKGGRENYW